MKIEHIEITFSTEHSPRKNITFVMIAVKYNEQQCMMIHDVIGFYYGEPNITDTSCCIREYMNKKEVIC